MASRRDCSNIRKEAKEQLPLLSAKYTSIAVSCKDESTTCPKEAFLVEVSVLFNGRFLSLAYTFGYN